MGGDAAKGDRASAPVLPRWIAALPVVVLLLTIVSILRVPERIAHDCALYLQCGQMLLDGQLPYVDFVDLNPPLIMYVNTIPALLARLLSLPIIVSFSLCVVALAAWSTASIHSSLARAPVFRNVAGAAATIWAMFTLLMRRSSNDFGQREHLFLLLYMPYLVARSLSTQWDPGAGRPGPAAPSLTAPDFRRPAFRALLGLAAGCGLCLKPQYALVAAGLELYWLLSARHLRSLVDPEVIALVVPPLLYVLHFTLLPPVIHDVFLHRWLPFVSARYGVYDQPLSTVLNRFTVLAGAFGVCAALASPWLPRRGAVLVGALGVFSSGAVAVYVLQHKGWTYHQMPAVAATALLLTLLTEPLLGRILSPFRKAGSGAVPLSLILTAVFVPLLAGVGWIVFASTLPLGLFERLMWDGPFWPPISLYTDRGDPVLFVSTSVSPAYPLLVQKDRRPGTRYLWFFSIPMLAAPPSPQASATFLHLAERDFLRDLTRDIASRRPPIIFVQATDGCQGCPPWFNVMRYLTHHGVVHRLQRDHTRLADIAGFAVFVANDRLARGGPAH